MGLFYATNKPMKKSFLFIASLLALASVFSCKQVEEEVSAVTTSEEAPDADRFFIPGEIILQLDDNLISALEQAQSPTSTKSADFNAVASLLQVYSFERVFPEAGKFEARHRAAGLHRWYRIRYSEDMTETKAGTDIEDLFRLPGVPTVERPRVQEEQAFNYFNDPYAYYCWFLENDGTLASGFKKGSDINVVPVWEQYTTGSKDIIVAVVDSGVDLNHEDLSAVVLAPGEGGSQSFVEGYDPMVIPAGDHGTNVAGIIAAVNNNKLGGCSVAGGSDGTGGVRIMSCAASDGKTGALNGDTEAGIVWAADNGACIVNNSWGHGYATEEDARKGSAQFETQPSYTRAAIDYFIDYAGIDETGKQVGPMKGGLVVFSAGNSSWRWSTPASYSRVVAVGAFQHNNAVTGYSNYGTWVDIWAPGGGEESAEQMMFGPLAGGGYAWMAGTSQAAPCVSGVAALLLSYYGGPGFTAEELKEKLIWGAKFGVLNMKDKASPGGRLDAYGSFTYQGREPVSFTTDYTGGFTFKSHQSVQFAYTVHGNDDGLLAVEPYSNTPIVEVTAKDNQLAFKVDAMKGNAGTYQAGAVVGKGTPFEASLDITFTIEPNHAPIVIKALENQVLDAETGETRTIDLTQYFSDPDGETLSYVTEVETGSTASASVSANTLSVKALTYGQTAVKVTVSDAHGETVKGSFSVLNRNTALPVDLYPNPVTDFLVVRPVQDGSVTVQFINQAGSKVLEQSFQAGLYQPFRLDVSKLSSGLYTVVVNGNNLNYRTAIMKL